MDINIEKAIDEIIQKYYEDEYYSEYRYDKDNNEFHIITEIKEYLNSANVIYNIDYQEGFHSCGYDNDFIAIAWLQNNEIKMKTVLLESM